jgi:hypothetical protein
MLSAAFICDSSITPLLNIGHRNLVTSNRGCLSDAIAHRTSADHNDLLDFHGSFSLQAILLTVWWTPTNK